MKVLLGASKIKVSSEEKTFDVGKDYTSKVKQAAEKNFSFLTKLPFVKRSEVGVVKGAKYDTAAYYMPYYKLFLNDKTFIEVDMELDLRSAGKHFFLVKSFSIGSRGRSLRGDKFPKEGYDVSVINSIMKDYATKNQSSLVKELNKAVKSLAEELGLDVGKGFEKKPPKWKEAMIDLDEYGSYLYLKFKGTDSDEDIKSSYKSGTSFSVGKGSLKKTLKIKSMEIYHK